VAAALLEAAVAYAAEGGAAAVEGYPKDTGDSRRHANEMFVGSAAMFRRAGFEEVARRSPTRPLMRRSLGSGDRPAEGQRRRRPRRARR
jgi:ribosomal protein S18 acetylase RimI-like enzyme